MTKSTSNDEKHPKPGSLCFFTTKEVAEQLGVSPRTIKRLIERRELPFHRVGRLIRFALEDVRNYASRGWSWRPQVSANGL